MADAAAARGFLWTHRCKPPGQWRVRSVPAEAARRDDRLKFAEIDIADRPQGVCGRGVLDILRHAEASGSQ